MAHDDFRKALAQVYHQTPCQVLPQPLWQALDSLDAYETAFASDQQGITRLEAWQGNHLHIYWRRSGRQPSLLINRRLEFQQSAVIHQDFLDAPTVAGFDGFASYYRLIRRGDAEATATLPDGYRFAGVVESPEEVQAVITHLEQNDPSGELAAFGDWLNSPVFTADLWLWVVSEATEQPVGLGIGEIDPEHREAVIRWVQVLPDVQRQGLGRASVHELLRRIADRADFTTVSGPVEDRNNPGAFFRRCGFTGDDVWWVLRRA
jgi:GNAT superfamily N-acetyltransferase